MQLDLDLAGRTVLVVGGAASARLAVARFVQAGAAVSITATDAGCRSVERPKHLAGWRDVVDGMDLVVLVDADAEEERMIRAVAGRRTWILSEAPASAEPIGTVTLIGGGPGDDGLLTLAARDALARADIIYVDRLAPQQRLREFAPGAEIVDVGKTPGHHAIPQHEIERRMVASALEGRTVARLKGGDPYVFGRGGEEVAACRAAGVPVTVIPGVTSAIAVPAAAGIPVTYREVSRMFTVVSGHAPLDDAQLAHLAGLGGTIVVLMGVSNLPHLTAGLARFGMPADMPLAIIERGTQLSQRTTVTTVSDATEVSTRLRVSSPAVIVVGEVVRLMHHGEEADRISRDVIALAGE
ncbi:uroporphyrinogen-III C-methyltransferase [Pseudolysinimonas yzui]|uniref:uroporphyrinogen-III C-methyltransferase n=1 Tax=Pseudolysinimonas yzui TaxID=2708254 RepID=A0A8J3M159_9MICO|nr:uroporphyrinogen-III C-methyltransferase [Pseudolysinimonas yzui]GHF16208.1 uroporphyrinogen-III C-methyltransferase [Pseudolysinimonas yzui]